MSTRRAIALGLAISALAGSSSAQPAPSSSASSAPASSGQAPDGCGQGIPEATAKSVFAKLAPMREADGCVLDAVDTERYRMRIRFTKDKAALPEVVVASKLCSPGATVTGKSFGFTPAAELTAACPATIQAMRGAFEAEDFGGTIAPFIVAHTGTTSYRWIMIAAASALVVGAILYGRSRAKKMTDRDPET